MPEPMSPQPRTPTFLIVMIFLFITTKDTKDHEGFTTEGTEEHRGTSKIRHTDLMIRPSVVCSRVGASKPKYFFVFLRALCGSTGFTLCLCGESSLSLQILHDHRNTLAAADACRGQAILSFATAQFVQQRNHQPRSCCAQRMAQRNRAAIDVHFVAIETKLFFDGEILPCKSLV